MGVLLLVIALLMGSGLANLSGGVPSAAVTPVPGSSLAPTGTAALPIASLVGVSSPSMGTTSVPTHPFATAPILPLSDLPIATSPTTASALTADLPAPLSASTATNQYIQNYAQPGNIIQVGGSNQSLAVPSTTVSDVLNVSTGWYLSHGFTDVARSTNGGSSWQISWPGQATAWTSSGNPNYGDVLGWPVLNPAYTIGVSPYTFAQFYGYQPDTPVLGSTSSGSTLYLLSGFASSCLLIITTTCQSNLSATFGTGEGIAATYSTTGGASWSTPVPIYSAPFWHTYTTTAACGTYPAQTYIVPGSQVSSMALAVNTYGDAMAAFTLTQFNYASSQLLICNTTASGSFLQYNWNGIVYSAMVSSSTSGSSWTTPVALSSYNWTFQTLLKSGVPYAPLYNDVRMSVGPAPTETVSLVYTDLLNGTAFGEEPFLYTSTSNNGSTWASPSDIAGIGSYIVINSNPGWFVNATGPDIAADNWSGSSHKGNLYLVWNDNRSTTSFPQSPGYPSIAFSRNTGTSWSSTIYVSTNNPSSLYYFDPSISVSPNGDLWVTYYGVNPTNGNYHVYGVFSTDAGTTWSSQFVISDTASAPGTAPNALPIFGYASSAATSAGTYVSWEDCRALDCTFTGGNTTAYLAEVHSLGIDSATTGLSVNVTIFGVTTSAAMPAEFGVDQDASVTILAPTWVPAPNGTYIEEFVGYSGAVTSSSNPTTFAYTGGNVTISYAPTPGSWIQGTISPTVVGTKLTVKQVSTGQTISVPLTTGTSSYAFNATVPGGSTYTVTATAPNYQPATFTGATTNFHTTTVTLLLQKETGTIVGSVSLSTGTSDLANVTLTLNGSTVSNAINTTTGRFTITEPWGVYAVAINSTPTSAYLGCLQDVTVQPGGTASMICNMKGAWINGTVSPYPVSLTINGAPVALNVNGVTATWVSALPGGTYTVNASEPGYSHYQQTFTVKAGQALSLSGANAIVLTDKGTVQGQISPTQNGANFPILRVNGQTYPVLSTGDYSVTITATAGPTSIVVSLTGYNSSYNNVTITAGETSWLNISLTKTPTTGCTGSNCPPPPCNQTGNCTTPPITSTGIPLFDYVGIGLILVLVVIAAIYLMTRRRPGTPTTMPAATAPPAPSEPSGVDTTGTGQPGAMGEDGASSPPPSA